MQLETVAAPSKAELSEAKQSARVELERAHSALGEAMYSSIPETFAAAVKRLTEARELLVYVSAQYDHACAAEATQ